MDRRRFLQAMAASTAALKDLAAIAQPLANPDPPHAMLRGDNHLVATIALSDQSELPKELQVSFRLASSRTLSSLTANGRPVAPGGRLNDAALFATNGERKIEVVAAMD